MGCGGSKQTKFVMSGAHQGTCAIKVDGGQTLSCEFAGRTLPRRGKNQDRFGMKFSANALIVGIFDGHSVDLASQGIEQAEGACTHLINGLLPRVCHSTLSALGPTDPPTRTRTRVRRSARRR